jgi:hypothetical protein
MESTMNDEMPTEEEIKEFEELQEQFEDAHYVTIGKGITAWSGMENILVLIAAMLLDTPAERAGLVFYSINNFHTWLSLIDELFAMNTSFQALRSEWTPIAERLKKLNDTRVRLAHHAVQSGKRVLDLVEGDTGEVLNPSLRASQFDTRSKSKKHAPLKFEQLVAFVVDLVPVTERLVELMNKMAPIHLGPKQLVTQKLRELWVLTHPASDNPQAQTADS